MYFFYVYTHTILCTYVFFSEDISKRFSFRTQINIFFCIHTLHKLGMCRFIMTEAAQKSTMCIMIFLFRLNNFPFALHIGRQARLYFKKLIVLSSL